MTPKIQDALYAALRALINVKTKPLRTVLLLHPVELPVAVCLFVIAAVFTLAPETLGHTAVSFERRGIVHHLWHYALLFGSALTVIGLLVDARRALLAEFAGVVLLAVVLAVNLIALIAEGDPVSGMALATRGGLLLGLLVRAWILVTLPSVPVRTMHDA